MRKIAVGGVLHETNGFHPRRTRLRDFRRQTFCEGDELIERLDGSPTAIGGILRGLDRAGYQAAPLLYATAIPSGLVTHETYRELRIDLLDRLRKAMPVDGVLLALHGAMVTEGEDDCEGDLLEHVRVVVGSDRPVVATLDMHANVSPKMVRMADALVAYNTNPHLDTVERGIEAAEILRRTLDEGLEVTSALARPPLLLSALNTWTERPPLRPVHERAEDMRRDPRVVNVSVCGGFAYVDTAHIGVSIVVTAGKDAPAGRLAQELAEEAWSHRQAATGVGVPPAEAVERAVAAPRGPVILADVGDNVGGGSPGDGTVLLRELLRAGATGAVVVLADPQAVDRAARVGVGATATMRVGGKSDTWHGEPVQVRGTVERLTDGRYPIEGESHFATLYGEEVDMGRCAVLRCKGVRVLLTTRKTPPGDLGQLRSQGIPPEEQHIIVVKSPVAFRGAYEPIAADIIVADTPGLCTANLDQFSYDEARRPIFPLDRDVEWL